VTIARHLADMPSRSSIDLSPVRSHILDESSKSCTSPDRTSPGSCISCFF
jgi:hypothetical protein